MGGLPRRTTTLNSLRSGNLAHAIVDAGGSLSPRELDDLDAARKKADLVARVFARDGIDAMALSERDWRLGKPFVEDLVARYDLPIVASNLVCDGERPFPRSRTVLRGGYVIGVTGITDGIVPGCTVTEPIPAVTVALAELSEADVTVVLMPAGRTVVRGLDDVPVDVAVLTGSAARLSIGDTLPVATVGRGKSLGVLTLLGDKASKGVFSAERVSELQAELVRRENAVREARTKLDDAGDGAPASLRRRLEFEEGQARDAKAALDAYGDGAGAWRARIDDVALDDQVADDAETLALVKELLAGLDARAGAPILDDAPHLVAGHGAYVGSDACLGCHPAEHAQWAATPHATAWEALRDDSHGRDESCVGCHVTGWQQSGGPATVETISAYRSVQCEACHGPARAHLRDPGRIKPVKSPDLSTCTACHDGDRDGGRFDAETYLPRVRHGESQ